MPVKTGRDDEKFIQREVIPGFSSRKGFSQSDDVLITPNIQPIPGAVLVSVGWQLSFMFSFSQTNHVYVPPGKSEPQDETLLTL